MQSGSFRQPRQPADALPPACVPPVGNPAPVSPGDDFRSAPLDHGADLHLPGQTHFAKYTEPVQPRKSASSAQEQALVLDTLPLVKTVVGRVAITLPPHIRQEDLLSAGVIGLMDAAHRYDPGKGMSFKNYAAMRVRGAILDELRRLDWVPRAIYRKARDFRKVQETLEQRLGREATEAELAREMGMPLAEFERFLETIRPASFISLDDVRSHNRDGDEDLTHEECIADPNGKTSLDASMEEERSSILVKTIRTLDPDEHKVLALYYYEGLRLKEIAEVMGVSVSRVCQIHTRAIQRIRRRIESAKSRGSATLDG